MDIRIAPTPRPDNEPDHPPRPHDVTICPFDDGADLVKQLELMVEAGLLYRRRADGRLAVANLSWVEPHAQACGRTLAAGRTDIDLPVIDLARAIARRTGITVTAAWWYVHACLGNTRLDIRPDIQAR